MLEINVCDWLSQQAFAYRNKGRIQDLYSRSKLSCLPLRLIRRHSWKIRLFALVAMSLQCSFTFTCGIMVILRNLMVFAYSICLSLMFRMRLVCLFGGFLNSMYFVFGWIYFNLQPNTPFYEYFECGLEIVLYQPTGLKHEK